MKASSEGRVSARSLPLTLAVVLATTACAPRCFAAPAPLMRLEQVTALSNAEAAQHLPVEITGTVTYVRPSDSSLFLIDGGIGLYVTFAKNIGLRPGDRVQVIGETAASFRPTVTGKSVKLLSHGQLPQPVSTSFSDLMHARLDCRYVTVTGRVLAAEYDMEEPNPGLRLELQIQGGTIEVTILHEDANARDALLGADIRVNGTVSGDFDSKMELAGVWIDVGSPDQVTVLHRPLRSVWEAPRTPISEAGFGYQETNKSQRIRLQGTLTYFEPGTLAVLQKGDDSLLVLTHSRQPLHAGDAVEVTGFPQAEQRSLRLIDGQLRRAADSVDQGAVQPKAIHWDDAAAGRYAFDLVSMEGYVVAEVKDARMTMYVLRTGSHLFSATMRANSADAGGGSDGHAKSSQKIEVGSLVRVTGICIVENGNHWRDKLWFDLRMRSPRDVTLMELPSWWTLQRLMGVIGGLGLLMLASAAWVVLLERKVRQQTRVLKEKSSEETAIQRRFALYEQRRGEILEMISRAQPVSAILDAIVGLVSFRLHGAHCWIELEQRWEPGARTQRPGKMSIASEPLLGPDGERLGALHLSHAFHITDPEEMREALRAGARLVELAITTQRLSQELRHRSEYDLLTDIPNRFSFERRVTELLEKIAEQGGNLGLIYVDLDRFKEVNDQYGHRVGDIYLQQVAKRMKGQMRGKDMLARIGGDEFIALIQGVKSRQDVEEVAQRLERCFASEFELDGYRMRGSASIGLAVAPEDSMDKDELQRVADMAMYLRKQQKREEQASMRND